MTYGRIKPEQTSDGKRSGKGTVSVVTLLRLPNAVYPVESMELQLSRGDIREARLTTDQLVLHTPLFFSRPLFERAGPRAWLTNGSHCQRRQSRRGRPS
jgi:hypothetical protein